MPTLQKIFVMVLAPLLILGMTRTAAAAVTDDPPSVKWEYKAVSEREIIMLGKGELTAGLNALGAEHWELVAVRDVSYFFKRPLEVKKKTALPTPAFPMFDTELVSATDLTKLNLTKEQKQKYEMIHLEFVLTVSRLPDPRLDSGTRWFYEVPKLRKDALDKVAAILFTPEQQEVFKGIRMAR